MGCGGPHRKVRRSQPVDGDRWKRSACQWHHPRSRAGQTWSNCQSRSPGTWQVRGYERCNKGMPRQDRSSTDSTRMAQAPDPSRSAESSRDPQHTESKYRATGQGEPSVRIKVSPAKASARFRCSEDVDDERSHQKRAYHHRRRLWSGHMQDGEIRRQPHATERDAISFSASPSPCSSALVVRYGKRLVSTDRCRRVRSCQSKLSQAKHNTVL